MHKYKIKEYKTIWLDCDGVLLDYLGGFLKFIQSDLRPHNVKSYNLEKLFNSPDDCYTSMHNFSNSSDYADLDALVPMYALEMLRNFGYDIEVITQVTNEASRMHRVKNLSMKFGNVFNGIHFVSHGDKKSEYIQDYYKRYPHLIKDNSCVLVDDSPKVLSEDYSIPIKKIGILHSYNTSSIMALKDIKVVDDTWCTPEGFIYGLIRKDSANA